MLCLLLLVQVSSELFESFEPFLNPGDIFYPTLTWKATPAYLSSNHAGVVIDLTLYFYTQVEILKGYYAVLTISSDILLTTTIEEDQLASEDNLVEFKNIIFPTSQTYGPLRLIIYSSAAGQIIASCVSYGGISVAPAKSSPGKLTIEYEDGASVITSTSTTLVFGLTLTQDTQIDDYFEINITDAYKIGNDIEVSILDDGEPVANFQTSFSDEAINIFHFTKEMQKGEKLVVTIEGFSNPDAIRPEPFNWEFAIYRFGTRTIRQRFTGQGPQNGLQYPSIYLKSWLPTHNYSDLIVDSVLYMDLIIQMNQTIPDLVAYNITFSGVDILSQSFIAANASQSEFPITDFTPTTCVIDPITIFPGCKAESSYVSVGTYKLNLNDNFVLRLLLKVTSEDAQVDEVRVFYNDPINGDFVISSISDVVENPIVIIQGTTFENFRVYFSTNPLVDGNEVNFNGENLGASMVINFVTNGVYRANSKFNLSLPLNISGPSNDKIYLGDTTNSAYLNGVSKDISVESLEDKLIFIFKNEISNNIEIKIILKPKNTLYLPYFASNLLTTYEAMLTFKDDDVSQGITRIYIQPQKMNFSFEPLCSTAGLPGLPVKIQVKFPYKFSAVGIANYLEINIRSSSTNFASDMNSGIPSTTLFSSYNLTETLTITYGSSIYLSTLKVYYKSFDTDERVFYIPFAEMEAGVNYTIAASAKHVTSEFKTFEIFTSESILITGGATISSKVLKSGNKYVDDLETIAVSSINVSEWKNEVRTVAVSLSTNSVAKKFVFNEAEIEFELSNNKQYQYLFGFSKSNFTESSESLSLTNFKVPWYETESFAHVYLAESDQFNSSLECLAHLYLEFNVIPKEILLNDQSCNVLAFGPSSQMINLSYSLKTPSLIETYFSDYVIFFELNNVIEFKQGSFELFFLEFKLEASLTEAQNTISSYKAELTSIPSGTYITLNLYDIISPTITEDSTEFVFIENFEFKYLGHATAKLESISCTIAANNELGNSTSKKLFIFPNQRDINEIALSTYFQIQATFDIDIPALSNITLVGHEFDPDEKVQANTWCSHIVGGVAFTQKNYLSIINLKKIKKNELFELRKDISFSIPNDPAISYTGYFLFNITYRDIIIVLDTNETECGRIEYLNNSYVELTISDISAQKYNRGELVFYTFEFKIKSHETSSDWAYVFDIPGSYDSHFGNATVKFPQKQPDVYYLNSKSSLANIECTIDHWIAICTGFEVIQSGTTIDISIEGYTPPRAKSEDFYMYIVNRSDFNTVYATATSNLNKPFEAILGDNIDLISVAVTEPKSYDSQYVFQLYLDSSFIVGSAILFSFPIQYNLPRDNPEYVKCSANYNGVNLTSSQKCKSEGKFITFSFSSQIQISGIVNFYFEKIMNPFIAWSRNSSSIPDPISSIYDLWTQKFEIYIILENAADALKYDYKSYMNKNAGYAGFNKRIFEEFLINDNDSLSIGYSLNGCPGTISVPIKISVRGDILLAQNITIKPWEYYEKIMFDQASYDLTFENPVAYFRMKIPTNLQAFGQYYIAMNISESPLLEKTRYGIPTKIPVYITLDNSIQIAVGTIYKMNLNEESMPVKIDLGNQSPASNLIVDLSYSGKGLDKTTWSLNFKPGQYFKYFTVIPILKDSSYEITMKLSDTDKFSFQKVEKIIMYLDDDESTKEDVLELFDYEADNLKLYLTIKLSNPSIIYWVLGSQRRYFSNINDFSFEEVQKNSYDPENPSAPSSQIISNQESRLKKYANKLASLYSNYEEYSLKLIEYGEVAKFYGAEVIGSEETVLGPYDILLPGIKYTLLLFAFNGTANSTIQFETDEIEPAKILDISIESGDVIDESDYLDILTGISNFPNNRFSLYTSYTRRMKQYSQNFLVYSSPRYGYNSSRIVNDIKEELSDYPNVSITDSGFERNKNIPYIKKNSIELYKDTFINLTVSLSEPGKLCCIIEISPDTSIPLFYYDLYLGYGRNRQKAFMSNCSFLIKKNMTDYKIAWQFADVANYTGYLLSCTSCNLYPVLPQCNETYLEYSFAWIEAQTSVSVFLEVFILWSLA